MSKTIVLHGAGWQTADDFYDAFFAAVGAPEWHGRNLNALSDSIGTGDINRVEAPYTVKIDGVSSMSPEALRMVEHFHELVGRLREEGLDVSTECEP